MKIAILGPVSTERYFGGVAIFTEGLADSFKKLGHDVTIFTDYAGNREQTHCGSRIIAVSNRSGRKSLFTILKLRKLLIEYTPEVIISSLEYSLSISRRIKAVKIHFLHGFTNIINYGYINFLAHQILNKYIWRHFDYIVANSNFTRMINEEIFGLHVDTVINPGVSGEFIRKLQSKALKPLSERSTDVLFVGRLVKAKKVDTLIKALAYLSSFHQKKLKCKIIGNGPEEENLKRLTQKLKVPITFCGRMDTANIIDEYINSKIFVSLNPHEPFGIVFLEALLSGCKIVCPQTGGQLDFLMNYSEVVQFVDAYSPHMVAKGIIKCLESSNVILIDPEYFSYDQAAKKILNITAKR